MTSTGLSLDDLTSWAVTGGPAPVELTEASVERIAASHQHLRTAGRSGLNQRRTRNCDVKAGTRSAPAR